MKLTDKLEWLMTRDKLNKHTLAQKSGVPYTTIVGLFERGPENARLSTIIKLCSFFKVSLDYLAMDEYDYPEDFKPNGHTVADEKKNEYDADERRLIALYRSMNETGMEMLKIAAQGFSDRPELQKESRTASAI